MSEEPIEPKLTFKFLIKNIRKLISVRFANLEKGVKFIDSTKRMENALIPNFEGYGQPMDEGMIYLLFNSEGKTDVSEIDSVWRVFWVTAPDLKFHQIETFLISEKLGVKKWIRFFDESIFKNRSKDRFYNEVDLPTISMVMDGKWDEGYDFKFEDKGLNDLKFSGEVNYKPMKDGTIVYYNGRTAVSPTMYQRFYDSFGLGVAGKLKIGDNEIDVSNARGILEHGIGIFSTFNIYEWRWLNIQFEHGALQLFHHPMQVDGENVKAGEGGMTLDGEWLHILRQDYDFKELEYVQDERLPTKVPISWEIEVKDENNNQLLLLKMNKTIHHSWNADAGGDKYFIVNYILDVNGMFKGREIHGKGTMEYLLRRTIE